MEILKHGKYYRHGTVVTCGECGCIFKVSKGECDRAMGTDHRWTVCPECNESILLRDADFDTPQKTEEQTELSNNDK